jgi:hypothetical protein
LLSIWAGKNTSVLTEANIAIPSPVKATKVKEAFKLNKSAINPIKGGPIKNPKKEMVEMMANATPGEYILDLPAVL